jgi:excisionase family DNA binding protein
MTLDEIRGRATLSIAETSELLGLGINQTYTAARTGELPALRLGRSYRVPVPALLALLGEPTVNEDASVPAPATAPVAPTKSTEGLHHGIHAAG